MAEIKTVLWPQPGGRNLNAFLDMLGYSEGTDNGRQPTRDRGYDVLVGGGLFTGYAVHPNVRVSLPKLRIVSTAAGRYQILYRFWEVYRVQLRLNDFSPIAQDLIALQLIKECRATDDIRAGRFATAVMKCRSRWASLPGAGYGQHEHGIDKLEVAYRRAGGVIA